MSSLIDADGIPIAGALRSPDPLAAEAWLVVPDVGPPHHRVTSIELSR